MCRHMYDWNIVNCDVKQTIQLNSTQVYGQKIIDVPVCEIEPRRQLFSPGWEQRLYKFCFIWVKKYVG